MDNDYLTGLLPLHIFMDECDRILAKNPTGRYAITATDLSNLKYINDFYGMEEGNNTILEMAEALFIDNPRCEAASRPYADQFRALLNIGDISQEDEVARITAMNNDFIRRIQQRYPDIYLHLYTGLYIIENNSESIRFACDKAHFAKKCIKGDLGIACGVFDPKAYEDSSKLMTLSKAFQYARSHNKVFVYFQPKFSASTGKIIGAEALGRMRGRDDSLISPGEFIPVLEKTGIINEFDDIILDMTFAKLRQWIDDGQEVVPVSVNLSRIQFLKPGLVNRIIALQRRYNIPPELIELEITETAFIQTIDSINEVANQLRSYGFRIDVDDFGSGYSSLSLIATLAADTIKLDCSFARKCLNNEKGISILSGLIEMLTNINFDIICEGIETAEERDLIMSLGCDKIQGYFYERPLPSDEFEKKYIYKSL